MHSPSSFRAMTRTLPLAAKNSKDPIPALALPLACRCRVQAQGQAVEQIQLLSTEDPGSGTVPALAVTDADGWQFCLVALEG